MSHHVEPDTSLAAVDRLEAIRRLELLDRPPDPAIERIVALAAATLDVPVAMLSLVDDHRQFFTSARGIPEPWASRRETPLTHSFCLHVVRAGAPLAIDDARRHPLVHDNLGIESLGVEAYLGHPIAMPDGAVIGSLSVADRQPRRWTEREARLLAMLAELATREVLMGRAARSTAALLEHASDAYVALDEDRRVTELNATAERLLGARREMLLGRPAWEIFPEALARAVEPVLRRALRDGEVVEAEVRAMLPVQASPLADAAPPSERVLEMRVLPSRDGAAVLARDVTARRRAEEDRARLLEAERRARVDAEAANRAKSDFLAVMSHELRTPLNAIAGHVQLVELGLHGPVTDAQLDALDRVQRAQRHLLSLIDGLLQYAKLEAGRVEYDVVPTQVADVLADVLPLIEPQARARGIVVRRTIRDAEDGGALRVWADRARLGQVLLNLLANAVKFTPPGTDAAPHHVDVELAPCDGDPSAAELRVRDYGIGIPHERQATIFEPFVQVGRALNRPQEGTGLGLAISRDLARGMGGGLHVHSTEGKGATFTITLRRVVTRDGRETDRRVRSDRRTQHERRRGEERRHT